ncbi:hypothetical protein SADUNF_Sadunf08G0052400 [Salix dunnii]|uniref:Uncharacterized protein n=1 Tax=Salix dunnii TaxID=1413687 RepID=A0A835MU89_9ROSI|nr:hypothetical protein SADUNF_Sadunf08G0052400 [Salix dunnii]
MVPAPSGKAFEWGLRLRVDDFSVAEYRKDTSAPVSRMYSRLITAASRTLSSTTVPSNKDDFYDSSTGCKLEFGPITPRKIDYLGTESFKNPQDLQFI